MDRRAIEHTRDGRWLITVDGKPPCQRIGFFGWHWLRAHSGWVYCNDQAWRNMTDAEIEEVTI